ncbi:DUF6681 family protein [Ligilactobacillus animalis]|uniref:DUF6681 family protein n=1 Tax=Ligilactobacillus animalis TaxID=1605 RepID=UPI00021941D5|nr:DUF6681 family protein [Ligilactobacillus animalis]KRM57489.1 hypothetical protein FC30_GL001569 [Ligilactobacillus animalis KCTC 3501 = DSM 20602]MDO5883494.1 hypothetical protein [Ligilactobacillus animalis]MDU8987040.1 DUF6681 family protein [Ligilactobacillus animalis]OCX48250.1 hypothetical protein BFC98_05285 [Ligilactobacillus animalis]QHQ69377.1 hypothetical protein GSR62_00870 [Ligilactobacillus animalis]
MFSILGMINSYIGYFNMNATLKNRIYTIVGGVGNFYLLYVAYRFFANGFIVRGLLFILAFLALLYFTYLNILYFFTEDRVSKLDISPKVEKMLGVKIPDTRAAENAGVASGFMQTNGIFKDEEFLPSTLRTNHKQRENLQKVVAQLEQVGYLQLDFGGAKDKELFKKAKSGDRFFALNEPVALPYYELREVNGKLLVYGGVNQIERQELGEVTQVGLLRGIEALKRYRLSLAAVALTGGPYKFAGRSTMMQKDEPYRLGIQIAYRPKEEESAHLGSEIREDIERVKKADETAEISLRRRRDK